MSKSLLKNLPELVEANVISTDTADRIKDYYQQKQASGNRLILVFSILGSLLIGLGIILIIAHNWEDLSKGTKLTVALLPLLISQVLCAIALWRKKDNTAWREGSSVALILSAAAAISIVSQVYNIEGSLGSFLFTWMCISIPVVYVMRSMMASLLVICGITWYATELSYFKYPTTIAWYYWLMLAAMIFFYLLYVIKHPGKNFRSLHAWFIGISLTITLGMFGSNDGSWLFAAYISMFSGFILTYERLHENDIPGSFAFAFLGSAGQTLVLLILTFKSPWREISLDYIGTTAMLVTVAVSAIAAVMLVMTLRSRKDTAIHPLSYLFLLFIPVLVFGDAYPITGQVAANILVLAIAVVTTKRGADQNNLVILNYGLAIFTALVLCRYFDTRISFLVRGLMFILVGASFFAANYYTIKKRKSLP